MCTKLHQGPVQELRVEVKKVLRKAQNANKSPSNITKEEFNALQELKKDQDRITKRQKAGLINILNNIKSEGGLSKESYRKMYPTGDVSPKYDGLPKIHKAGTPLRPIISSTGTATYNTAKELARILKPLVGTSIHHVQNTRDFIKQIKDVRLKDGENIISYDVTSLFTSVPIKPALDIIQQRLTKDQDLHKRTSMTIQQIISLLEFCLNSTSFMFQGQYYQQMEGAAMGSPLSPIIANIFMEHFEEQALESAPHPPSLWKRFVDDTFVILETSYKEEFFHHINSLDSHIKFTVENTRDDGSIPFLDTLITPNNDGSLQTKVYRKPTHTNQYLKWDSHHALSNKYSVISSLLHRVNDICSQPRIIRRRTETDPRSLGTMQISNVGHQ